MASASSQPQRPPKPVSAYRAAPRTFVSSAPTCPRCDKSVYAAEQVLGPGGREYHKPCLTCVSCKKTVAAGTFEEHEGDPYCKHCYSKSFGPKGYGHGGAMIGEYQDPLLSSTRSPYASPARTTSRTSLSYTSNPLLDSPGRSARQSIDSKRQSFSTGRDSPVAGPSSGRTAIESPMSKYRTSRLQDLEDEQGEEDSEYTKTVKRINGLQLAQAPSFDDDEEEPAPSTSPTKPPSFRPPLPVKASSPTKPAVSPRPDSPASSVGTSASSSTNPASGVGYKSNLGILGNSGPDQCRRCGTTVYFAEKVIAGGHKWHKRCLRCATCSKALDSHLLEKDNLPYCKRCYDEQYGIRSQGFVLRPGLH